MDKYEGYFELHVTNHAFVPVLLDAFKGSPDYQLKLAKQVEGLWILSASPEWYPYPSMDRLCLDIRTVEKTFFTQLEKQQNKSESFVLPWLTIYVTVVEKKTGAWGKEKKIEGFPRFSVERLRVGRMLSAEISSHDSDYSGRNGRFHRAIRIERIMIGLSDIPSLNEFLMNNQALDEVFSCFEHFHG